MTHAPIPDKEKESERLAALQRYGILDTLPEESYDDLVAIAAGICNTPMASVSLIDADRKWMKARHGLSMTEIPRKEAFGAHVILCPEEVMVVKDAHADARFRDIPLVAGSSGVRFYAGAPLIASNGAAVGTLCVMDRTPRELEKFQIEALSALSHQVVALLELGVAHRELSNHLSEREWYERQLQRHQNELIAENRQLTELSRTDTLTGLLNRRAFNALIERAIATAVIDCSGLAMAIVDIDHFKIINDRHGHPAGDRSLVSVAHALDECCGESSAVARIGGEEFAIVLTDRDADDALLQCEGMRAAVETLGDDIQLTVSIGIAKLRIGDAVGDLFKRADDALYEAKRGGRNRVIGIA